MTRTARTTLTALAVMLLAAGTLAGCATANTAGGTPSGSMEPDVETSTDLEIDAAWLDSGRVVGIVSQGSSTCVPSAGDVSYANGVLDVTFLDPEADTPCTRDLVPRVTLVSIPEDVDPSQELEIRVTGEGYVGDTDLDGVPGLTPDGETDYLPSAGWTGEDGQLVLLTWGSSTCLPVVETVEATSATEITATFATPPADQVCTMDMAPRGTLLQVTGIDDDAQATLILRGAEFADAQVAVIGHD